jgi:cell division protein FtsA
MKHIYTSIDIGSDSIKVVTCELFKNKLNLLAASSVKSAGITNGLITNVEMAQESLKKAISEVEEVLGVQVRKVIASIPSHLAKFDLVEGHITFEDENHVINSNDLVNVLDNAIDSYRFEDKYTFMTIVPINFTLDGYDQIEDPKNLSSSHLKNKSIIISTPKKNIASVVSLVTGIGIEVVDITINALGEIHVFKEQKIKESIGAIINVGSSITTVSLYNKGIVVKQALLNMGGEDIDSDLATIYKLTNKQGRTLKEKFAFAHKMYAQTTDIQEIVNRDGVKFKINQFEVSDIAMQRLRDILENAKKELKNLTNRPIDYIILTGGTSNMAHFEYVVNDVFGQVAKVGSINLIGLRNNKFAPSLGSVVYFIGKLKLKGKNYTMFDENDVEQLSQTKKNSLGISNDNMIGKLFGFFFNE